MASFRNPPPEGFIFPNASEKRFLEVLEDLPSRWAFWYEPTVSGGQRPDFVIWVPAEEFPTIFLIELKSWRKNFVSKADLTHGPAVFRSEGKAFCLMNVLKRNRKESSPCFKRMNR